MKNLSFIAPFLFVSVSCFAQPLQHGRPPVSPEPAAGNQSTEVILYENAGYDGRFQIVTPQLSAGKGFAMHNFNDMATSVQVPKGMVAVLYEHSEENGGYGNYVTLMEDCPDLSVYNLNDKISHVVVFAASNPDRPGFYWVRPKMVNGQIVAGHWERIRTGGKLPDNSPPAVVQYLEPKITTPKPVVDEKLGVFRIQLRIVTGAAENEDTDKEVYVKLNNKDLKYFLDYGPDDFERGADKKYDIISNSVRTIEDIQFVEVGVQGNDVWGIKRIELYLNNSSSPVFSKVYSTAMRINGSGNYPNKVYFNSAQLRSAPHWQAIATDPNIKKPPVPVPFEMIKSMIESMVGNQLHHLPDKKLSWGSTSGVNTVWGDHVEGKRKDFNKLSFDLDLQYEVPGVNPEVDVDFDLVFTCNGDGSITIKTENVKTGCELDYKLLSPSCKTVVSVINGALQWVGLDRFMIGDFSKQANTFGAMFILRPDGFKCKDLQVTPKGDVFIY